jgi:membrane protease YdiL (CAAX protease family)
MKRWLATAARELESVRSAPPLAILASLLAAVTALLLIWGWLFAGTWLDSLLAHLGGVIGDTFVASMFALAIQVPIYLGMARLSLRDVGVTTRGLLGGLAIGFWMWLAAQVVLLVGALVHGDSIALDPNVDRDHVRMLVDQVAGNALEEEIIFRGFLLVQVVLLAQRLLGPRRRTAWVLGLIASQVFFALTHIPQRWIIMDLHGGALIENLASTAIMGILFALVYIRTGRLGFAVVVHALGNLPFAMVNSPLDPRAVYGCATLVLLVAWPIVPGARARRATDPPPRTT